MYRPVAFGVSFTRLAMVACWNSLCGYHQEYRKRYGSGGNRLAQHRSSSSGGSAICGSYGQSEWCCLPEQVHTNNFVRSGSTVGHHVAAVCALKTRAIYCSALWDHCDPAGEPNSDTEINIRFHGVRTKEIIEQATYRAFLECSTAHVTEYRKHIYLHEHI